jgi:C1A family cysteine protease
MDQQAFEYMQYVSKFGKSYSTLDEFNARKELFLARDQIIKEWNSKPQTSTMGHNFLSDWTAAEQKTLRGLIPMEVEETVAPAQAIEVTNDTYDTQWNWCSTTNSKSANKCTPIKNQGQCGGCYSFSATEAMESAIAIFENKTPVEYSTQQCISCSSAYGNGGCNGGNYQKCWKYFETNPLETETSYPYSSGSLNFGITGTCTANASLGVVETTSTPYVFVGQTNAEIISGI